MPIEIYTGRGQYFGHERDAFAEFAQDMYNRYGDSDINYFMITEMGANAASIDILLLHSQALIIVDLKNLTAANPADAKKVKLSGKQNGPWHYILPEGTVCPLGGAGKRDNPYQQLFRYRHEFAAWLADRSLKIFGERWKKDKVLDHLSAWVVVSPGFDNNISHLDLPWEDIEDKHGWFRVLALENLAWEFNCASIHQTNFLEPQIRALISELGVTRIENLAEILPVPPASRDFFFSTPPVYGHLIDRETETAGLIKSLENTSVCVTTLRGLGGGGKTALAAWLVEVAKSRNYRVCWLNCAEKEVTDETFLAAIANNLANLQAAGYILNKDKYKLEDRMEAALEALDHKSTLLVLDDFHKISRKKGIDALLTYLVQRARNIKILLTTREHPTYLDNPLWPSGVYKEILVKGLPYERIPEFFAADLSTKLSRKQWKMVYERTSGNPYAMRLLISIVRKYGWGKQVEQLPLFNAIQSQESEQWFSSLLETLSEDARQLLFRLSVCRSDISQSLIDRLWHVPNEAEELTFELINSYLIQAVERPGIFHLHEFVKDYLYVQLRDDRRKKYHEDAGKYYSRQGDLAEDILSKAEFYNEAVYHYEKAQNWKDVLQTATRAFDFFNDSGDWDRAQSVAQTAVKAARLLHDEEQVCYWLVKIANREFDQDLMIEANKHLMEALNRLPKILPKTPSQKRVALQKLEAQIYLEKGRLAYYTSDFVSANKFIDQALALAKLTKDRELEADSLIRIGRIERQKAQYERAETHFIEASVIAEEIGDQSKQVESISHLGLIARKRGELETAQQSFQLAYQKAKAIGDKRAVEINLSLLGDLARRQGDYQKAEIIFRECLEMSRDLGNGLGIRVNLGQLAEVLIYLGAYSEAGDLLQEAEQRSEQVGDGVGIAWTLRRKGLLLKVQGDIEAGDQLIHNGIDKLREIGNEDYIDDFRKALGPIQLGLFIARKEEPPLQKPLPGMG